jgi:3-phenylpropionate/cinnamic acid dioxygenase small subunit
MDIEAAAMGLAPALALRLEVEDFLYREAELVDDRKLEEWLALFADELQYRVPMARNLRHDKIANEYLSHPLDVCWIDEGKETLAARAAQIRTGVHWAEEPLSRTAHLVTNVRVIRATPSVEDAQEVEVSCKFLIYRNRNTDEEDTLIGKRVDVLRRSGSSWLICRRTVYIAQSVLLAKNLSFFV